MGVAFALLSHHALRPLVDTGGMSDNRAHVWFHLFRVNTQQGTGAWVAQNGLVLAGLGFAGPIGLGPV